MGNSWPPKPSGAHFGDPLGLESGPFGAVSWRLLCGREMESALRSSMKIAAVMSVAALALAACGTSTPTTPGSSGATTAAKVFKVGMAYDVGGRGDQSFNDAAAVGLDKAKVELKADTKEATAVNGEAESAREERLS